MIEISGLLVMDLNPLITELNSTGTVGLEMGWYISRGIGLCVSIAPEDDECDIFDHVVEAMDDIFECGFIDGGIAIMTEEDALHYESAKLSIYNHLTCHLCSFHSRYPYIPGNTVTISESGVYEADNGLYYFDYYPDILPR